MSVGQHPRGQRIEGSDRRNVETQGQGLLVEGGNVVHVDLQIVDGIGFDIVPSRRGRRAHRRRMLMVVKVCLRDGDTVRAMIGAVVEVHLRGEVPGEFQVARGRRGHDLELVQVIGNHRSEQIVDIVR